MNIIQIISLLPISYEKLWISCQYIRLSLQQHRNDNKIGSNSLHTDSFWRLPKLRKL